jgi:type I restriction enzyme M protein
MLTGELKNKVDQVWNAFWTGGISNPLEVVEQIESLEKLKSVHCKLLANSAELFAALQQRAFSGEL